MPKQVEEVIIDKKDGPLVEEEKVHVLVNDESPKKEPARLPHQQNDDDDDDGWEKQEDTVEPPPKQVSPAKSPEKAVTPKEQPEEPSVQQSAGFRALQNISDTKTERQELNR